MPVSPLRAKPLRSLEVIQALCGKLIYRHPHIDGRQNAGDSEAAEQNWEKLKLKENQNKSVLGGGPNSLPSLIKAVRMQEKVRRVGFTEATSWQKVQKSLQHYPPSKAAYPKSRGSMGRLTLCDR